MYTDKGILGQVPLSVDGDAGEPPSGHDPSSWSPLALQSRVLVIAFHTSKDCSIAVPGQDVEVMPMPFVTAPTSINTSTVRELVVHPLFGRTHEDYWQLAVPGSGVNIESASEAKVLLCLLVHWTPLFTR